MTFLAFEESADDLKTTTQFVAAGSTVNLLPAGNDQVVVVDTNAAPTRQIDIEIEGVLTSVDFIDLNVGLPTEIGQTLTVVRDGPVSLSVRIQTEGDVAPFAINMHEDQRSTQYVAKRLTDWFEIVRDGAGSSAPASGGTGVEVDTLASVVGRGNKTPNDVEITDSARGIIRTDGADRWRETILPSGSIQMTKI